MGENGLPTVSLWLKWFRHLYTSHIFSESWHIRIMFLGKDALHTAILLSTFILIFLQISNIYRENDTSLYHSFYLNFIFSAVSLTNGPSHLNWGCLLGKLVVNRFKISRQNGSKIIGRWKFRCNELPAACLFARNKEISPEYSPTQRAEFHWQSP